MPSRPMPASAGTNDGAVAPAPTGRAAAPDMAVLLTPSSLPLETRFPVYPLRLYGGFWLPEFTLPAVVAVHTQLQPRPDDVILASFPKSGTTWLKALAFATLHRDKHPPSDGDHPLRRRNPHDCVKFIESPVAPSTDDGGGDVFEALPSPRLLATHLPYCLLPRRVTADGSGCRIVYICRDPKDTLVSNWLFFSNWLFTKKATAVVDGGFTIEEAFELFCDGRCGGGPQWRHVLEYWEESRRWPEKVLFLRYEEMLRDPASHVKKLAAFMGRPFSGEEVASGVVRDIVELCCLGTLKSMAVNKNGARNNLDVENDSYFRKGMAGAGRLEQPPDAGDGGAGR